jgi:hypothetical protein
MEELAKMANEELEKARKAQRIQHDKMINEGDFDEN